MGFPQFTMEDFFDTFMDTLETLQKVTHYLHITKKTMTIHVLCVTTFFYFCSGHFRSEYPPANFQ